MNCWEFKKCGREPGGKNAEELGVCPASIEFKSDGMNSGVNGGRCCWALTGTLCQDQVQGDFTEKANGCLKCEFYQKVLIEESKDGNYSNPSKIIKSLKNIFEV
jgi:eukaryotic-like serine/threonine-protein kinase